MFLLHRHRLELVETPPILYIPVILLKSYFERLSLLSIWIRNIESKMETESTTKIGHVLHRIGRSSMTFPRKMTAK